MIADKLIVFTYLDTDIIQMAVDTVGFEPLPIEWLKLISSELSVKMKDDARSCK